MRVQVTLHGIWINLKTLPSLGRWFSIDGGDVPDDPEDFDIDALLQVAEHFLEVNLSNADFSGQDLSQRDFGLADFSNSNLRNII